MPQHLAHRLVTIILFLCILLVSVGEGLSAVQASPPPVDLRAEVDAFLGISYRNDGALDEHGRYTTFRHPGRVFSEPGLNCSGLVVALSRTLLGRNQTLSGARVDRRGDSGPASPLGEDWDFGWDLILNVSDGFDRRALLPEGAMAVPAAMDDGQGPGFAIGSAGDWRAVLPRIKRGRIYLGTMNRPAAVPPYRLLHHHVVVLLRDGEDRCWLYQATARDGVHRIDLATFEGLRRLQEQFPDRPEGPERILIVEVTPGD